MKFMRNANFKLQISKLGRVFFILHFAFWLLQLIAFLLLSSLTKADAENGMDNALFKEITSSVFCPCGCDRMLVSDCNCGTADKIREFVKGRINSDAGKEVVIEELKSQYGEQIIPISPESGFGLMAWVVSILAFFAGASVVVLALKTWVSGKKEKAIEVSSENAEKYRARIESELGKYK